MTVSAAIQGLVIKMTKNTENFKGSSSFSITKIVISIINWIIFCIAIYLSFKCNKGFKLESFLLACCCSPFYLIYRIAVPC